MNTLGETQEQFIKNINDDTSSVADSDKPLSESDFGTKISMTSTPSRRPDISRMHFNDSSSSFGDYKVRNGLLRQVINSDILVKWSEQDEYCKYCVGRQFRLV